MLVFVGIARSIGTVSEHEHHRESKGVFFWKYGNIFYVNVFLGI